MIGLAAGKLNRRIELLSSQKVQNELLETIETWSAYARPYAEISALTGREFFLNERRNVEVTHSIKIRYRPGVRPDHRVKYCGRTFDINFILNTREANVELILVCKEAI